MPQMGTTPTLSPPGKWPRLSSMKPGSQAAVEVDDARRSALEREDLVLAPEREDALTVEGDGLGDGVRSVHRHDLAARQDRRGPGQVAGGRLILALGVPADGEDPPARAVLHQLDRVDAAHEGNPPSFAST